MANVNYVEIRGGVLREVLTSRGMTLTDLSRELYRSSGFISHAIQNGKIQATVAPRLREVLGDDADRVIVREVPKQYKTVEAKHEENIIRIEAPGIEAAIRDLIEVIREAWK